MSGALFPFGRPLGVGEVLDGGFRLFQRSLVKCLPFAAAAALVGQLPSAYRLAVGRPLTMLSGLNATWIALSLFSALTSLVMWGAVLLREYAIASGRPTDAVAELGAALRCSLSMLVVGILSGLAIVVGLVCLLVPGVYLATALALAAPAVVLERIGPFAALGRSMQLVSGNWWRTTAIFSVALVIIIVLYVLGAVIGTAIAVPLLRSADVVTVVAVTSVVLLLIGALGQPLIIALLLATYEDLNVRRQGSDLEQRVRAVGAP